LEAEQLSLQYGERASPAWLDTAAVHGHVRGRVADDAHDKAIAASAYARLVAQGKDVKLWESSLRQQIYVGGDAFIDHMHGSPAPEEKLRSMCRLFNGMGW
jgi:hypothetical protein